MDRRSFIATIGAVPLAGTAGCVEDVTDGSTSGDDETDTDESTGGDDGTDTNESTAFAEDRSEEAQRVSEEFGTPFAGKGVDVSHLVVSGENVLTRASLLAGLELQRTALQNEAITDTLTDRGMVGLENVVPAAVVRRQRARNGSEPSGTSVPTLDEQIEVLESLAEAEFEQILSQLLEPSQPSEFAGIDPFRFLPIHYEVGTTTAETRQTLVFQATDGTGPAQSARDELTTLVEERFEDAFLVEYSRQPPSIELSGEVTHENALTWVQTGTAALASAETVVTSSDGEPDVETPATVLAGAVGDSQELATLVNQTDTTGDGVPDQNLTQVYDALLATDPDAKRVIVRTDGEYRRLLMLVGHRGNASVDEIVADLESAGEEIERQSDGQVTATATIDGEPVS